MHKEMVLCTIEVKETTQEVKQKEKVTLEKKKVHFIKDVIMKADPVPNYKHFLRCASVSLSPENKDLKATT